MKTAQQILNSKPFDMVFVNDDSEESVPHYGEMDILDAMEEHAEQYAKERVEKALKFWKDFEEKLQAEVYKDDSDTMSIGEFVLDYFDLWK